MAWVISCRKASRLSGVGSNAADSQVAERRKRRHQHHDGSSPRRPNTLTRSLHRSGVAGRTWIDMSPILRTGLASQHQGFVAGTVTGGPSSELGARPKGNPSGPGARRPADADDRSPRAEIERTHAGHDQRGDYQGHSEAGDEVFCAFRASSAKRATNAPGVPPRSERSASTSMAVTRASSRARPERS